MGCNSLDAITPITNGEIMEMLYYALHICLLVFCVFLLIGLGYMVRDGIRDWQAQRRLNNHLRHVEMMRRYRP